MGYNTFTISETVLLVGVIFLGCMTAAQQQISGIALESGDVELTINIPNNQIANKSYYITIKHQHHNGTNWTNAVFLMRTEQKIVDAYNTSLTVSLTAKQLRMRFTNVTPPLAGMYRCFANGSDTPIGDCEQLLIVIRKPSPPTIKMLQSSSSLVGSKLGLYCEAHSNSLPPNHGLDRIIWWYDEKGESIPNSPSRIYVSAQGQLLIEPVERTDKGQKFYCISADDTGDLTKNIKSDRSPFFEILPEYKVSPQDFKFSPPFQNGDVITKEIGEILSYRCEAECSPQCNFTWLYKPSDGSTEFTQIPNLADRQVVTYDMGRNKEGLYHCRAQNIHGAGEQGFNLEALYMESPTIFINTEKKVSANISEGSQVNLSCVFDSNPGPVVHWISPALSTLSTQKAVGPNVIVEDDLNKRLYTSSFLSTSLKCEDRGIWKCAGKNDLHSADGQMELVITCPPSSASIPGLELKNEYVWEMLQPLSFSFVIQAFPSANITNIVSSLNGVSRPEVMPTDITISRTPNYGGKAYLTKFDLTSKRVLNQDDADRDYTMTIESGGDRRDFVFKIHPRGPPHEAVNIKAIDIRHDSLKLFWQPGFNGGETQTFLVEHRVSSPSEQETGAQQNKSYSWTTALTNITDRPSDSWVEVTIGSLRGSTDYVMRVTAVNTLGRSSAEIRIRTTAAPAESLGAGAICGIVFGVLLFLVIVAVVGFFIYRKKFGSGRDRTGIRMPERLAALFRRDKYKPKQTTSSVGGRVNGSARNESPWGKVRKIFVKGSSNNNLDYTNIPPRDYMIDSSRNESAINNNAFQSSSDESGRKTNEEGLVYIQVDFPRADNKNQKEKEKKKKQKKKNNDVNKSSESVNYSDIDFVMTAAKRKEIEQANRGEEATNVEEEEPLYENNEDASKRNKYADAGFGIGTTV